MHNISHSKTVGLLLEKAGEYDIQTYFVKNCYSERLIDELLEYELKAALLNCPAMPEIARFYEH